MLNVISEIASLTWGSQLDGILKGLLASTLTLSILDTIGSEGPRIAFML